MRKIILMLSTAAMLTGCGTIFSGSTQTLNFSSNITNVQIYANGALVCSATPCSVDVDRSSASLMIMAKAPGYEDNIQQIRSKINTASFLNLSSAYAWTTDFATSSMWKYSREGIYINMKRVGMRYGEAEKFKKDSAIRHFVLHNYPELKMEAYKGEKGEYLQALSSLTNQNEQTLIKKINNAYGEVQLAHSLVQ